MNAVNYYDDYYAVKLHLRILFQVWSQFSRILLETTFQAVYELYLPTFFFKWSNYFSVLVISFIFLYFLI